MSSVPSYLCTTTGKEISTKIFLDLQLDSLLSPAAQKILSYPLDKEGIYMRQELFSAIYKEENYLRIRETVLTLKLYKKAFELWELSSIPTEKTHLAIKLLKHYLKVCDALIALSDLGAAASLVADYFREDEQVSLRVKMAQGIKNASIILGKADTYVLTYGERSQISKFASPDTYLEHGAELFAKIGLKTPDARKLNAKCHITLSDSVSELFAGEYFRVNSMLRNYLTINFRSLFPLIRELDFYMEMRDLYRKLEKYNTATCLPKIADSKKFKAKNLYDISLSLKECYDIVPNDTWFENDRIFYFLTGANGGGKTTYLRSLGINLILFLGGMPIFAESAEIYPFSAIYTHFPKDERFASTGRLHEEMQRTRAILDTCDNDAFILFNETYSGTDDKKGYELLLETAEEIKRRGISGLYVTHFHEITDTSFPILGVEVIPTDENKRTFKITPKNDEKGSYAKDILRKYRLDEDSLKERS